MNITRHSPQRPTPSPRIQSKTLTCNLLTFKYLLQDNKMAHKQLNFETNEQDQEMEEVNPSSRLKRSPTAHAANSLKKNRGEMSEPNNNYNAQPWQYRLWFGFHIMDEQAKLAGKQPYEAAPLHKLMDAGLQEEEANELQKAKISFPRIYQKEWPQTREDQVPGQHYHLTQVPFDIATNPETGYALVYQIFLHFEKPSTMYSRDSIIMLTKDRMHYMQIELGNILEPVAPFCSTRDPKAWNGLIKIHLKYPEKDAKSLLTGTIIFALTLDDKLTMAKVAKGYDSPALQEELSIKLKGETLMDKDANTVLIQIVKESFRRGHEFEITQVNKAIGEDHAYIVAASPEQREKIIKLQVTIDKQIIAPSAAARKLTAKEVAKKNCLVIIARNLNLTQPTSEVAKNIQELIGDKLIVDIYFNRAQGEMHNGTANIEVLNPAVYKKFVKQTVKIGGKHVKLAAHPRSLDGLSPPDEATLREFGFLDVNTAIANAVLTLEHTPVEKGRETITKKEMASFVMGAIEENSTRDISHITQQVKTEVRGDLRKDLQEFKHDIVEATKSYTDSLTNKLKLELDTQFETMMMTLNNTKKMLNGDTPTRPALPAPHNSPN
jgi:hypothetical protein